MKRNGYYSSGEFAKMADVSVRTIRFYDKQNLLKPSLVTEKGARFYTDQDLVRLQQILLLKYLGFSLDDIRDMTIGDLDEHYLYNALRLQMRLIQDRIEQMQMVEKALEDTTNALSDQANIDWSQMLDLIHLTNMEKSLKSQYKNATNIDARVRLHSLYSTNKIGWFPWIFHHMDLRSGMKILELGCGNGSLWRENRSKIPSETEIYLTDISSGMIRDVRRTIGSDYSGFHFRTADCHAIPFADHSMDLIIANHVLFYCTDLPKALAEISRVLKPGGRFLCSTYGKHHMMEMNQLVQEFDSRIFLSAEKLYDQFGLENGAAILSEYFSDVSCESYDDSLFVDHPEPLIEYILSCHGNQNQYLLDRYKEFRIFVDQKTRNGFSITKDAGLFLCKNSDF